jgi:trimeric autotransporter adhesin
MLPITSQLHCKVQVLARIKPNSGLSSDTVCLLSLANCTGTGGGIAGSGTQNYITKFDTLGGNHIGNASLYDDGSFVGLNTTVNNGLLSIQGATTTQSSLFVQGTASATAATAVLRAGTSQTGNLAEFQSSTGSLVARISGGGGVYGTNVIAGTTSIVSANSALQAKSVSTTSPTAVIQGGASQTGDLLQLWDNAGSVLAKIDITGSLTAVDGNFGGNVTQTGSGTLSTGTGNVTLNGATTISGTNTLTVGTGATSLGGTLGVTGLTTLSGGATISGTTNINTAGSAVTTIGNAASTLVINAPTTLNGTGYINTNSATAFKIEQNGVKNNVLVVDTTNGVIGINQTPTSTGAALQVAGSIAAVGSSFNISAQSIYANTNL